jgi:hypothetical protein
MPASVLTTVRIRKSNKRMGKQSRQLSHIAPNFGIELEKNSAGGAFGMISAFKIV